MTTTEDSRDTAERAVIEAARRFAETLTMIPHWREHSGEDAAALVAAVQQYEEETNHA